MIGNDIVDLNFVNGRKSLNKRFLNKVFNEGEQRLIRNARIPEQTLWLLWAMKESAFKLNVQWEGAMRFVPLHYKVNYVSQNRGCVEYKRKMFYSRFKINIDHVLAETTLFKNDQTSQMLCHFDNTDYQTQHRNLKVDLKKILNFQFGIALDDISLKKNSFGVPQVYFNNKLQYLSFSLSHHGKYGLISFHNLRFNRF